MLHFVSRSVDAELVAACDQSHTVAIFKREEIGVVVAVEREWIDTANGEFMRKVFFVQMGFP